MRILLIHTHYTKRGGEDAVFENEYDLLKDSHEVKKYAFHNDDLQQLSKAETFQSLIFNKKSKAIIKKEIESFRPDVIHIHNLFYIASPSILHAAKEASVPVVMTLHNFRLICNNALLLRNGEVCEKCIHQVFPIHGIKHKCFQNSSIKSAQLSLVTAWHKVSGSWKNQVNQYIVFSDFLKEKFIHSSVNFSENQVFVKPNFVLDPKKEINLNRKPFFLFVGRLSKEKGIDVLLEAFKKSEFSIEIIGGGEYEHAVKEADKSHANIVYHGFQNKEFILSKLSECQALVFPSIWYEGMPMTILESFSVGTPVVISDMKNIKDMVKVGVNGVHFRSGNASSLEKTIRTWENIKTPQLYKGARKTFEEKYSPSVNLSLLETVYQKAISAKKFY